MLPVELTAFGSIPDVIQRVPRLPAISTKGSPTTEDPFAELLFGLPFGQET